MQHTSVQVHARYRLYEHLNSFINKTPSLDTLLLYYRLYTFRVMKTSSGREQIALRFDEISIRQFFFFLSKNRRVLEVDRFDCIHTQVQVSCS